MDPFLETPVNYVNAPHIARERGIQSGIPQQQAERFSQFNRCARLQRQRDQYRGRAVFSNNAVRLVRVNHFYLEAVLDGHILVLNNRDVPGVVGAVGSLLGQRGINIAGLELGRERVGGMAISLIHVDGQVPREIRRNCT